MICSSPIWDKNSPLVPFLEISFLWDTIYGTKSAVRILILNEMKCKNICARQEEFWNPVKNALWYHKPKVNQPVMFQSQQLSMDNIWIKKLEKITNFQGGIVCTEMWILVYCLRIITIKYWTIYDHVGVTIFIGEGLIWKLVFR